MAGWYLMPHHYHLVLHFWWRQLDRHKSYLCTCVTYVRHVGVPTKFFNKGVPAKLSKLSSLQKIQYQKYQLKYQPLSAGNLLIPARQPVLVKIPATAPPSTYHTYLPLHSDSLCWKSYMCIKALTLMQIMVINLNIVNVINVNDGINANNVINGNACWSIKSNPATVIP